jgi:hypothetical protein
MSKLNWWKTSCVLFLLHAGTASSLFAQHYTTLHSFDRSDGASPQTVALSGTGD